MEDKKRAFIYIRVSTQEQAEEGYSLGEQEDRLKKYCEAMGWNATRVYCDPGYSGGNMDRPALQEMISEIKNGNTDIVVVDKLDRLSRSQFDTLFMIKKIFNLYDVAFVSRAEAFDTSTPFGRAMVGILAVFAELERERIKERMQEGKVGRIKEGKFRGGNTVPYGYNYNPEDDVLTINPYESMVVKEIFELLVARTPIKAIVNTLNSKGYLSKTKTQFGESTIRGMIENQVYIGKQFHKGEWIDALHEPIIPIDLWNKSQAVIAERKITNAKYKPGRKYNAPLAGMLYCKSCGAKYHWKKIRGEGRYICYSRSKSDSKLVKNPHCKAKIYIDSELEAAVFGEVKKLRINSKYIEEVKNNDDSSKKIAILKRKIKSLDKQISKCMDLYTLDDLNIDFVKERIQPLSQERTLLQSEVDALELARLRKPQEEVLSWVDMFEELLGQKDNVAIHSVVMELIDYVEVGNDEISIHWNF